MDLLLQLKMRKMFIFQVSAWCYQHLFCADLQPPNSMHPSLTLCTPLSLTSYLHSDHWSHWPAKFWFCVPTINNAFICVIYLSVCPPFQSFCPALSRLLLLYPVWLYWCGPAQSIPVKGSFSFHDSQSGGLTLGFCAVHSTTCGLWGPHCDSA